MPTRRTARRATLADVAAAAGVSPKTVSRVVNGEPHVSPSMAARVREAVDELQYRPDRRARDLASGPGSALVGFVQVDAGNPFFAAVARGLDDQVRGHGHLVISASTDADPVREAGLVAAFAELRVQGLVVAAAEGDDDALRREVAHGTAVACIDRVVAGLDADTVVADNRDATRAAVSLLAARGHRRIGFVGGSPAVWTARERHAGYRDALADHGLAPEPVLQVVDVDDPRAATDAVADLLAHPDPPSALFTAQDRITLGAVRALRRLGRLHDVALVGFDDLPQGADLDPPVAVVAQDPREMGRVAGRHLLERLTGAHAGGPRTSVVPTVFRDRASAAVPAP